jgi:hypothetical protein
MGNTWGINSTLFLWMYTADLLPELLYASVIWWPMVSKVAARNLLRSLLGSYLRAGGVSMKTTPTEAKEVALCQTPLDLAAIEAAGLTACRLKWRNTRLDHTKHEFLQKYTFTLNQDRILKKLPVGKAI